MKRFKVVYTVLAFKDYDVPIYPDLFVTNRDVKYFENLEDALEYAKYLKEAGWDVIVFKAYML